MIAKGIRYFGSEVTIACDANCEKAWGVNNRPRLYLGDPEQLVRGYGYPADHYPDDDIVDLDDYCYLADDELGIAPDDPGTYEGVDAKPVTPEQRLNRWCCRECERCSMFDDGELITPESLKDLSRRFYNIAPHYREPERESGAS